jgi:hypothetical protein
MLVAGNIVIANPVFVARFVVLATNFGKLLQSSDKQYYRTIENAPVL